MSHSQRRHKEIHRRVPAWRRFLAFFRRKLHRLKGFTVLELLVVIGVIGVLASVLLASLSNARSRSRDAKRVSDIREIQKAIELYFDANREYPLALAGLVPNYFSLEPRGPLGFEGYYYERCTPTKYYVGTDLEHSTNPVFDSDLDQRPLECPEDGFGFAPPGATNDTGKCLGSLAVSPLEVGYCYDVAN